MFLHTQWEYVYYRGQTIFHLNWSIAKEFGINLCFMLRRNEAGFIKKSRDRLILVLNFTTRLSYPVQLYPFFPGFIMKCRLSTYFISEKKRDTAHRSCLLFCGAFNSLRPSLSWLATFSRFFIYTALTSSLLLSRHPTINLHLEKVLISIRIYIYKSEYIYIIKSFPRLLVLQP